MHFGFCKNLNLDKFFPIGQRSIYFRIQ